VQKYAQKKIRKKLTIFSEDHATNFFLLQAFVKPNASVAVNVTKYFAVFTAQTAIANTIVFQFSTQTIQFAIYVT